MTTLSDFQRGNLLTLARGLWDYDQSRFGMGAFIRGRGNDEPAAHVCGTAACAVGNAPGFGIPVKGKESWWEYSARCFIDAGSNEWAWMFSGGWSVIDNTPRGAARRILYFLRHGLPDNWVDQSYGHAPLSYLNEPLPAEWFVTLPQPLLSSSVKAALAEAV